MRTSVPPHRSPPRASRPARRSDDPTHGPSRSAQSHEAHFLSRAMRCQGEDLERAMRLYHNSHAVRIVLEDELKQRPAVERVAIPLRSAPPSPHVIVARGGRFVTCLGEEMRCDDLPRIRYEVFAEAMDLIEREWARLHRRKTLIERYDGKEVGQALLGGPGSFHRHVAESYIESDRSGHRTCEFLIRAIDLFLRANARYYQGQLRERRQVIEYTKLEGRVVILCYVLAGIRSEAVAAILDYYARHRTGFHEELMMALAHQEDGDDRLLAIAEDPEVDAERRSEAGAYAFMSLSLYPERADAVIERVLALPPEQATMRLRVMRGVAEMLRERGGPQAGAQMAELIAKSGPQVRPAARSWIFTPEELARLTMAARPTLELFPPQEEAEDARAAWDDWVRTRELPPPPKKQPMVRQGPRVGRNEPCPCGSGRKHKQCCLGRSEAGPAAAEAAPAP